MNLHYDREGVRPMISTRDTSLRDLCIVTLNGTVGCNLKASTYIDIGRM